LSNSSDHWIDTIPDINPKALKWLNIGHDLESNGKYQEAMGAYHKSLLYDNKYPDAYLGIWNSNSELFSNCGLE
jgi:hypothetical protein